MLKRIPKPIALSLVGAPSEISQIQKTTNFPIFSSPEGSLRALAILRNHHSSACELRAQTPILKEDIDIDRIARALDAAGEGGQLGIEALDVLQACGIPTVPVKLAATADEAASAASAMGYPVAMKIASKDILHKTDAGGVRLNIGGDEECREAFEEMIMSARQKVPGAAVSGVHVQKMAASGRELIIGATLNESFGHVVTFGVGGVAVEALGDISLRVAPIGPLDVSALLDEIKASRMLGAFRGMPPADRDALKDVLYRVSTLVTKFPQIKELDINPVIAYEEGKGCAAVDARIILR
jgi:acyl-CoA synthetase (NDP forming)